MNHRILLTALAAALALAPGLGAEPGLLKARDTHLEDPTGTLVQLKGTNLGGWLLQETWMCPVKGSDDQWTTIQTLTRRFGADKAQQLLAVYQDHWITGLDLDRIAALGLNVVRVPFGYWNLQAEDGTWNRKADGSIDFGRLDWIVDEAGKRGLYVILDLHGAPGFASDAHSSGKVGSSRLFAVGAEGDAFRQRNIDLWTEVARHFAGRGTVAAYDLLNEPMALPNDQTLWKFYDRLVKAIRAVDPDHLISVEAIWELSNLPDPKEFGWTNMLYQTHDYGWNQDQKQFIAAKMASAPLARLYNVPVLVGEFNAFDNYTDWARTLVNYDKVGFSWTTWTWKMKKGTSSWGVYANPFLPSPDLRTASFEEIRDAWAQVGTDNPDFVVNQPLAQALQNSARRPALAGPGPSASITPVRKGTRYEGEDAEIVLSSHHKDGLKPGTEAQGFFSGRLAAGGLNSALRADQAAPDWSNLPHVKFVVKVEASGTYHLVLGYNGDDDKTILVRTNGGPAQTLRLPQVGGGAWNLMHEKEWTTTLNPGENTVEVSGTLAGKGWENVDYLDVVREE